MQRFALLTFGLAAATSASLLKRQLQCSDPASEDCQEQQADYLQEICLPTNATGYPDFDAPCVQTELISIECMYGAAGLSTLLSTDDDSSSNSYGEDGDIPTLSNSTQRECICESQYWVALSGCSDCFKAHGSAQSDEGLNYVDPSYIASASSSYCAVTNTPTAGFDMFIYGLATGSAASSLASVASTAAASTFSDPIGNQTAVSYYYTPSVTGSAAWVVAQATESASNNTVTTSASGSGSASSESMATSNGQIVATAGAASTTSGAPSGTASGASGSASTSAGSGAGKHEAAAVAGVIAMAGFVALL